MFPPNQAPPMGAQPQQPAPPPQGGVPPQGGAQAGAGQTYDIRPNPALQKILLIRVKLLSPQDAQVFTSIVTQQTVPVLLKVFPELQPLFDAMLKQGGGGPIGQQPQQPPAGQGAPPAGGQPPQAGGGAPSAAQPGGAPGQESDDDESDNPLVKSPASSGLIG